MGNTRRWDSPSFTDENRVPESGLASEFVKKRLSARLSQRSDTTSDIFREKNINENRSASMRAQKRRSARFSLRNESTSVVLDRDNVNSNCSVSTVPPTQCSKGFSQRANTVFSDELDDGSSEVGSNKEITDPFLDEMSSFLDTMHAKNIILKRMVSKQQESMDALSAENQALRLESELKDVQLHELKEKVRTMENDLTEMNSCETATSRYVQNIDIRAEPRRSAPAPNKRETERKNDKQELNATSILKRVQRKTESKASVLLSPKLAIERILNLARKASNTRSLTLTPVKFCWRLSSNIAIAVMQEIA